MCASFRVFSLNFEGDKLFPWPFFKGTIPIAVRDCAMARPGSNPAYSWNEIYHFSLCLTLYLRAISKYKPPGGAYIWRGDLSKGFLCYEFGGLIHGGAVFGILLYPQERFVNCW